VEEQTIDGEPIDPQLAAAMKERVLPRVLAGLREARGARPDTIEQTMIIQRRYLDAMRDSLATERSIGAYSSATYRQVEALLDSVEQRAGTS